VGVRNDHKVAVVVGIAIQDHEGSLTPEQDQILSVVIAFDASTEEAVLGLGIRQVIESPG
jgi:hypothetical protein